MPLSPARIILFFLVFLVAGCATSGEVRQRGPAELPPGSKVQVLNETDEGAIIGVKGVEILYVEIYGRGIQRKEPDTNGEWKTFFLPRGRWFNFRFLTGDGDYRFVYVTREDAAMPPVWMDSSITTFQPPGGGAAMTVNGWRR